MKRRTCLLALSLMCLLAPRSAAFADHIDGMTLRLSQGPGPGDVTLDWTGGQPAFKVYRSTSPSAILDPGNLAGTTSLRTFGDTPPPGNVFYYEIASPCVYNPPEICNGLDDDCDGTVDGPVADASCVQLPFCSPGATCNAGACTGGTPRNCDDSVPCTLDSCNETLRSCEHFCSNAPCWAFHTTTVGGNVAVPAFDTRFNVEGGSFSYISQNTDLYSLYNTALNGHAPGTLKARQGLFNGVLYDHVTPVMLSIGGEAIFATDGEGKLFKLNPVDLSFLPPFNGIDLRRPMCPNDKIVAAPTAWLSAFSNAAFNLAILAAGHPNDDLLIVITRYDPSCDAGSTKNRVFAVWASNLTVAWTFNLDGSSQVGFGSEGCSVDYGRNSIDCGTDQPPGAPFSLWAINSIDGHLLWSGNAGSIHNRPELASTGDRLYVSNSNKTLQAYAPGGDGLGGALPLWTTPVALPVPGDYRNLWVEARGGAASNRIFAVSYFGEMATLVVDSGTRADIAWSKNAAPLTFSPASQAVLPAIGKAFLGRSDGTIQQINLNDGTTDAAAITSSWSDGSGRVWEPALDFESTPAIVSRLVVASGFNAVVQRYCAPFLSGASPINPGTVVCRSDLDCPAWSHPPCSQGTCDIPTGVCYARPVAEGAACSSGNVCLTGETCRSGICTAGTRTCIDGPSTEE